jgi:hypothetical protein
MDREKFQIPMPDDVTIQSEITKIVAATVKQKQSFPSYLRSMYRQVGIRHLFSDRTELVFILFSVAAILSVFLITSNLQRVPAQEAYAFIFLISPILFLAFSLYTYANKVLNTTFEVEMACKYNVYQIIAFRMLAFSVVSILINTGAIAIVATMYKDIEFARAFMISITALFAFSILFLYALMKQRTKLVVAATIAGWVFGNLLLRYLDNNFYFNLLADMSLVVYALVLFGSLYFYIKCLKKLIQYKQTEGAY